MSVSAAIRKSRPTVITAIALWTLVGSAAVLAFGIATVTGLGSSFPDVQVLYVSIMIDMIVAGPFGYLFPSLSLTLAAAGIATGIGTLYGRRWAKWLNVALSAFVLYQGAMLLSAGIIYPQVAPSWTLQDWSVPIMLLAANAARVWYVLFSAESKAFFG